jgi:small subunit ribosomal protein S1
VDTYYVGDELEGKVTKVVAFGAFVEILEGVEGLVHISELAPHHVENPREVVSPGDDVRVKILEIDSERRRLSLSVKRVEGQELPIRSLEGGAGDLDDMPELGLSEDVFAEGATTPEVTTTEEDPAVPEGVDEQVEREAEASPGDGETPGSVPDA